MGKIMAREAVLLLFCGLFAGVAVPLLLGRPPGAAPFAIGLFYGLSFIAAYAIMLMLGQRLPAAARGGLAALAWLAVVWGSPGGTAWYLQAAPGFSGLAVAAMAAGRGPSGKRAEQALWALFAFSAPMFLVRYLLVPMVSINLFLTVAAVQTGAFYLFLRGLFRVYAPNTVEVPVAGAEPLVKRRPVPDAVVGLLEGTLHRRARPYATLPDFSLDESAVSLLVRPDEVEQAVSKAAEALQDRPFDVEPGVAQSQWVELVIRARK